MPSSPAESIQEYASHLLRRPRWATSLAARGLASLVTDFRLLARRMHNGPVFRQAVINGIRLLVRADEDVGRQIFCLQAFEPDESAFLRANILEEDQCVDVGANVGYFTLLLAALADKGQVHAFEPVPLNYHLLESNLIINGFGNVVVNRAALTDVDGDVEFNIAGDSAYSSMLDTGRKPVLKKVRVPALTLDHYCEQRRIETVNFLKIDVEGAEELVLKGAAGLLSAPARRPRLVLLELYEPMLSKYGSGIGNVVTWMGNFGYKPFIVRNGFKLPFQEQHYNFFYNVFFSQQCA